MTHRRAARRRPDVSRRARSSRCSVPRARASRPCCRRSACSKAASRARSASPARKRRSSTMTAAPALRRDALGFVYQFHHLLPDFNAIENVDPAAADPRRRAAPTRERARESLLGALGLGAAARPTARASFRAASSSASRSPARSPTGPALVLADEPTGNLDEATADIVLAEFLRLVRERRQRRRWSPRTTSGWRRRWTACVRLHEGVLEYIDGSLPGRQAGPPRTSVRRSYRAVRRTPRQDRG